MSARRIKVLHVITRLIVGGAQETAMLLCQHLDPTRYDCTLVTGEETGPEGELHSESRARGVALEFEPDLFREIVPLRDIAATVSLTRRMFRGQYDIVHLHSSKAGIVGRLAARLAEVPVVVHTVHGWGFNDEQHRLVSSTYQSLERACARWCDALVVVGSPYRDEGLALGIGEPSQYHLIRSGIEIGAYRDVQVDRAAMRASLGIPADAIVIGNVGRLSPPKCPELMVQAFARLATRHANAHLVLVGDGWQRAEVEAEVARLGLTPRVHLLGLRRDVPELLRTFDVFMMSSSREGLPRTLPQAMAAGLPVVATHVGGIPDAVHEGETGFLVPSGDVAALADRLERLVSDPALRVRLGEGGRRRVEEFSVETMVRRTEALYERLLARRGA
jgi:glycosyltransferase involved in cell wall biosynthesis